ncbi:LPXTG cell wall anchor domain-containing protein [Streptococcus equi]|uniref:Iron ABC transporter permease n=1 Tax=Streptococcus equi subsp. zooepidemicus Sz4is TaxID=1381082 RepID=A0AAW3GJC1_STRSZ|nr:iron ABC transporter permease [Streptococcus equi subsp. zooepidemicus Sz4is]
MRKIKRKNSYLAAVLASTIIAAPMITNISNVYAETTPILIGYDESKLPKIDAKLVEKIDDFKYSDMSLLLSDSDVEKQKDLVDAGKKTGKEAEDFKKKWENCKESMILFFNKKIDDKKAKEAYADLHLATRVLMTIPEDGTEVKKESEDGGVHKDDTGTGAGNPIVLHEDDSKGQYEGDIEIPFEFNKNKPTHVKVKVVLTANGSVVKKIIDNGTNKAGGYLDLFWDMVINQKFAMYEYKGLSEIKNIKQEPIKSMGGDYSLHIDFHNRLVKWIDTEGKKYIKDNEKEYANLAKHLSDSEEIYKAAKGDEYTPDTAKEFIKKYEEAKKLVSDSTADKDKLVSTVSELKSYEENSLKLIEVDKTELNQLIKDAESKKNSDYISTTFDALVKELKEAKKATGANIRKKTVDQAVERLKNALNNLKEMSTDKHISKVPAKLMMASDPTMESMAKDGLKPEVTRVEEGGKTTYYIYFKPINVDGIVSECEELGHQENNRSLQAKLHMVEGEYNRMFEFTRNSINEKEITVELTAKMGGTEAIKKEALLVLDLSGIKGSDVNKNELLSFINSDDFKELLESVYAGDYTDISKKEFLAVYEKVNETLKDQNSNQDMIDSAFRKIKSAEALYLTLKPEIKALLEQKLEEMKDVDRSKLKHGFEDKFDKAIEEAKKLITFPYAAGRDPRKSEIEKAIKKIEDAYNGVEEKKPEKKPDTPNTNNQNSKKENTPKEEKLPNTQEKKLADGRYVIKAEAITVDKKDKSMANKAIGNYRLIVNGDKYELEFSVSGIPVSEKFGYLGKMQYFKDGYTTNKYGKPFGEVKEAKVLSIHKDRNGKVVADSYGSNYPNLIRIPLIETAKKDGLVPIQVFVPVMERISKGKGTQQLYLKLDWDSLRKESKKDNEGLIELPDHPGSFIPKHDDGNVNGIVADNKMSSMNEELGNLKKMNSFNIVRTPETGDKRTGIISSMGIIMLSIGGIVATSFIRKKKRK